MCSGHQLHPAQRIPWTRLLPPCPSLHLGLSKHLLRLWLLPPSTPPETIGHIDPLGSFVPPVSPWSDIVLPVPSAPSGSALPMALPLSSIPPSPPLSSSYPTPPQTLVATAPPPAIGLAWAYWLHLGLHLHLHLCRSCPGCRLPSSRCHHGMTLPWGPVLAGLWFNIWLHLLLASAWLLPPTTPLWTVLGSPRLLFFYSTPSSRAPTLSSQLDYL